MADVTVASFEEMEPIYDGPRQRLRLMAFDEHPAEKIREALSDVPDLSEQRMFGGLAFLVGRNMACGIVGDELMLRLGEHSADAALDQPHVRPMDFTGRPIRTMVYVAPAGFASPNALRRWVDQAVAHAATLPPGRQVPHPRGSFVSLLRAIPHTSAFSETAPDS